MVDPDEMAYYELFHQDMHCLQSYVLNCRIERIKSAWDNYLPERNPVGPITVWYRFNSLHHHENMPI